MASVESFQLTYQHRTIKGLDQHEHSQATLVTNITLDPEDDPNDVISQAGQATRDRVHELLGLKKDGPVKQTVTPPKGETPTDQARKQPAPSQPAQPSGGSGGTAAKTSGPTENGLPVAPSKTNNVRGDNADKLADHLIAVFDAGNDVPQQQINRLPKDRANRVLEHMKNNRGTHDQDDGQEPAGSHDDPPVSGSGGDDFGDGFGEGEPTGTIGDTPDDGFGEPPEEAQLQNQGSGGQSDDDDLFTEDEPSGSSGPEFRDIDDEEIKSLSIQYAERLGGKPEVRPIVREYTDGGVTTIPREKRPEYVDRLEKLCQERGV